MILSKSRVQPARTVASEGKQEAKLPDLEDFLSKRDYQGALALLQFRRNANRHDVRNLEFLAYCQFHFGEHDKTLSTYKELLSFEDPDPLSYALSIYKELLSFEKPDPRCSHHLEGFVYPSGLTGTGALVLPIFISPRPPNGKEAGDDGGRHTGGGAALAPTGSQQSTKSSQHHKELLSFEEPDPLLSASTRSRLSFEEPDPLYYVYAAACCYYMGMNKEAESYASQGPRCPLQTRILFHCAHKMSDETRLMEYLALNVYVALCYCKLDYYDVSLEILQVYLNAFADSALAVNLKACNAFRMYNGKAAENELRSLAELSNGSYLENDLIRHNLVVFRSGENAMQEYILKGVVHASIGQMKDNQEHLKTAQQYFQLVGASQSECDTIPGRQCMASCFFLLKQFDDVLVFLQSVKTYFPNDDDFNWNYGIAKAATGKYKEAEEILSTITNEKHRSEYCYLSWLARCYIMNGRANHAWELYLRLETNDESYQLLQLIANDCYRMGSFFYAAKAFDVLERLDPAPEYLDGKKGACIGTFQLVIANKEPKDSLRDVIAMMKNGNDTSNPQIEMITRVMKKWAKENGVKVA
eukprot:gene13897-19824_t